MNDPCSRFRSLLEAALAGVADPPGLARLGWHAHLLGCAECRDLLEAEEALELLLASLPEPKLPLDLSRRVVLRLQAASMPAAGALDALDALLDLDAGPRVPPGLARDVRRRLEPELARARAARARPLVHAQRWRRAAAAALLVAGAAAGGWWWLAGAGSATAPAGGTPTARVPGVPGELDEGLLAALEVLEVWAAFEKSGEELASYLDLDATEQVLLDFAGELDWDAGRAAGR